MTDKLTDLERELLEALKFNSRACEMSAAILRDKRRTKATGAVAAMVERIARQFDRLSDKSNIAIAKAEARNG
jgi:hypothetical protein